MNIQTFLKFPGILIAVGILLLIVSIIIGIIAYKKPKYKEEFGEEQVSIEEPIYEASNNINNEMPINFFNTAPPNDDSIENTPPIYNVDEVTIEQAPEISESPSIINESYEEIKPGATAYVEETQDSIEMASPVSIDEEVLPEHPTPAIEDDNIIPEANNEIVTENVENSTNQEEFNTGAFDINDFTQAEIEKIDIPEIKEEPTIDSIIQEEINNEPVVESMPEINEEITEPEEPVKEEPRAIYGGTTPLENVTLDFKEEKHDAYSNTGFQPTGNIVTPKVEEKKDEDIELL